MPVPGKILTIANHLTLLRLTSIPILIFLLSLPQRLPSMLAAILFLLASFTDFLDGFFARRRNQVTTLGKLLDPLADKLLVTAALIMLIPQGRVPALMAFVIIAREIAVTGLRNIFLTEGIIITPNILGKGKFCLQVLAISIIIVHYRYLGIDFHKIGMFLLWIALIITVCSGLVYFANFYRYLQKNK